MGVKVSELNFAFVRWAKLEKKEWCRNRDKERGHSWKI